ncbi:hypothetical protein DSM106972_042240 [Dulcicalothrix desertica PCC 7102]|uniref:Uncharacterized protein n=1 Tax=Dulcicalothrix desertica PCC 7102 TaxID=232991 RepID=A0A3S1CKN4_9CYAN|nr:hypothetical protein DSM106972_042240 [Dulcicalothrix desertica PCC 7102]TWH42662.1 hypothetical protein CAL7102_06336 [Dulcicalothrix desertica PCC 7102]
MLKISKIVSSTIIATTLLLGINNYPNLAVAQTCASKCGRRPLQFVPGQLVRVEVVNRTPRVLALQKSEFSESIAIQPGQTIKFEQVRLTEPNISLLFWDDTGRSLSASLSKLNASTLRVELRPNWRQPGDRSVYVRDDGMINVL